ncbi:hypothetical protein HG536_0E03450 [Torulaspora globosa]|uniref:MAGE domain-containing protein n=1 Tax=Torulaspora globosa TaxID=48254 RepID=A0A7G3ZIU8_9SACH|nr:uncharacterized protein HG536_0E03450 [Torulaspora globosa]QLL33434.1 hypothetical protein HG536_0E03450 [Torulaspora globosa]
MSPRDELQGGTPNKTTLVAGKLVRFIMSVAESQNTTISRSRLQKRAKEISEKEECGSVSFNEVLKEVNRMLGDIYGYELKNLPPRSVNLTGRQAATQDQSASKPQHYILLDNKRPMTNLDDLIFSQQVNNYMQMIQDGQYIGGRLNYETTHTLNNKLGCDSDIALKGLLCIILCVVLFSKNHVLQQELCEHLESFGVATDGSNIPIVNLSFPELLRLFEKQEYLIKEVERSGPELDVEIYRIGRRTQVEFPLESLVHLVMDLMSVTDEQAPGLRQDIERNIADSYATTPDGANSNQ